MPVDMASDRDAWSDLNRTINTTTKNSLSSPWRGEVERANDASSGDSDYESLNVSKHQNLTIANASTTNGSHGNIAGKDKFGRTWNRAHRFKRTTAGKKKAQKYHWSGTFNDRVKRYSSLCDRLSDANALSSSCGNLVCDSNYNYNLDGFDDEKAAKKTKLFRYDKFNLDDESSENNENAQRWSDHRSSVDVAKHRFNIPQQTGTFPKWEDHRHRRDGIAEQENLCTPRLRRGEEKEESCKETRSYSAGMFRKSCSSIDNLSTFNLCSFLLSFLKNIVIFTFLPSLYVAFFIYVKTTHEER